MIQWLSIAVLAVYVLCVCTQDVDKVSSTTQSSTSIASTTPKVTKISDNSTTTRAESTTTPTSTTTTVRSTTTTVRSTTTPAETSTTTKPSPTSTVAPIPKPGPPTAATWYYNDTSRGHKPVVCTVVKMALQMEFTFLSKMNKTETVVYNLPGDTTNTTVMPTTSQCTNSSDVLALQWHDRKWNISLTFERHGNEKEYKLSNLSIQFDRLAQYFPGVANPSESVLADGNTTSASIQATVGNCYMCNTRKSYKLSNNVTAHISDMKVQAFREDMTHDFLGTVQECAEDSRPSNIVPIAVGAALAALVLVVLIAYIIGRNRNRAGYESV